MDWGDSVDLVEIVDGSDVGIQGGEITSHDFLGVDGPWGAFAALGIVRVDKFRVVACWLQGIAALEFKTSDQWFEEFFGGGVVVGLLFLENLSEKANHFLSDSLMSSFLFDLWLEITVFDSRWHH